MGADFTGELTSPAGISAHVGNFPRLAENYFEMPLYLEKPLVILENCYAFSAQKMINKLHRIINRTLSGQQDPAMSPCWSTSAGPLSMYLMTALSIIRIEQSGRSLKYLQYIDLLNCSYGRDFGIMEFLCCFLSMPFPVAPRHNRTGLLAWPLISWWPVRGPYSWQFSDYHHTSCLTHRALTGIHPCKLFEAF